jgi:hypothetical protein
MSTEPSTERCESVHFDSVLQCEDVSSHPLHSRLHMARDASLTPERIYIWRDDEEIDDSELEGAYAIAEVLAGNRATR